MSIEYVYMLQEREFIRLNENVYKIGKTMQTNNTRFEQYPVGSQLHRPKRKMRQNDIKIL